MILLSYSGSIKTKVAKDANATMSGADVQAKNWVASKNWNIFNWCISSARMLLIRLTKLNSQPYNLITLMPLRISVMIRTRSSFFFIWLNWYCSILPQTMAFTGNKRSNKPRPGEDNLSKKRSHLMTPHFISYLQIQPHQSFDKGNKWLNRLVKDKTTTGLTSGMHPLFFANRHWSNWLFHQLKLKEEDDL